MQEKQNKIVQDAATQLYALRDTERGDKYGIHSNFYLDKFMQEYVAAGFGVVKESINTIIEKQAGEKSYGDVDYKINVVHRVATDTRCLDVLYYTNLCGSSHDVIIIRDTSLNAEFPFMNETKYHFRKELNNLKTALVEYNDYDWKLRGNFMKSGYLMTITEKHGKVSVEQRAMVTFLDYEAVCNSLASAAYELRKRRK